MIEFFIRAFLPLIGTYLMFISIIFLLFKSSFFPMIVEVSFILYVYGAFEFIFLVASFFLNVQIQGF
jgi:hypothetical protein